MNSLGRSVLGLLIFFAGASCAEPRVGEAPAADSKCKEQRELPVSSEYKMRQECLKKTEGVLKGRVVREVNGDPIPDAYIDWSAVAGSSEPLTAEPILTNRQGNFRMSLPPGQYRIYAAADGFEPASQLVDITLAGSAKVSFELARS